MIQKHRKKILALFLSVAMLFVSTSTNVFADIGDNIGGGAGGSGSGATDSRYTYAYSNPQGYRITLITKNGMTVQSSIDIVNSGNDEDFAKKVKRHFGRNNKINYLNGKPLVASPTDYKANVVPASNQQLPDALAFDIQAIKAWFTAPTNIEWLCQPDKLDFDYDLLVNSPDYKLLVEPLVYIKIPLNNNDTVGSIHAMTATEGTLAAKNDKQVAYNLAAIVRRQLPISIFLEFDDADIGVLAYTGNTSCAQCGLTGVYEVLIAPGQWYHYSDCQIYEGNGCTCGMYYEPPIYETRNCHLCYVNCTHCDEGELWYDDSLNGEYKAPSKSAEIEIYVDGATLDYTKGTSGVLKYTKTMAFTADEPVDVDVLLNAGEKIGNKNVIAKINWDGKDDEFNPDNNKARTNISVIPATNLTVEFLPPNAPYRTNTDVITSFMVINKDDIGALNVREKHHLKADFTAVSPNGDVIAASSFYDIVIPKNGTNLLSGYDKTAEIHLALVYRGEIETANVFLKKQEEAIKELQNAPTATPSAPENVGKNEGKNNGKNA